MTSKINKMLVWLMHTETVILYHSLYYIRSLISAVQMWRKRLSMRVAVRDLNPRHAYLTWDE